MNIFYIDVSPIESARLLDDLRVNKMIIESAALLANAIAYHGGSPSDLPIAKSTGKPFKTTAWQNHPCCIWVKQSSGNYYWLMLHLEALIDELKHRKGTVHSMTSNLKTLWDGLQFIPPGPMTPPANCTPYKQISDSIKAYRITMAYKWEHDGKAPKWTNRGQPSWYTSRLVSEAQSTPGEMAWTGLRKPLKKRVKNG